MRTVFGLTWLVLAISTVSAEALEITELLASGTDVPGGLRDEDGDTPDWFEVTNTGNVVVDLAGVSVTDDLSEVDKWVFPSRPLGPGESIVVFASGKDRKPDDGNLHTSFKLSVAGEYLGLYSAEQSRQPISEFRPAYPEQRPNISYGIGVDGSRVYFLAPTPGREPGTDEEMRGVVARPVPSVPRGFYTNAFSVELTSRTVGTAIFFTTDGSQPSSRSGTRYTDAILIDPAAGGAVRMLRAVASKDGWLPSRIGTWTYVFPDRVLDQPGEPEGLPDTWGTHTTRAADYEMDPEILSTPEVRDRARHALLSLPTLSIVTDHAHLWDAASGVYMNGERFGLPWERPTSAELIFPDGRDGVQIDAGLRIQGGTSTTPWNSAKLSMRLLFRGDYGSSKLEFSVFPGSAVDRFDTLVLDAHHHHTYTHPSAGAQSSSQYCRDEFVSDLQRETGHLSPHSVFVNLYLNGLYWGLYSLHERPDASFQAAYLGGSKDEFDTLRHNGANVVNGDTYKWARVMAIVHSGLVGNDAYLELQKHFDVPGFIDYMIVNIFAGNTDWPHQNWYSGARRDGGRYRFFSWDAEQVLRSATEDRTSVDNGAPGDLYQRLQANAEYRLLFADHIQKHFVTPGGVLYVDPDRPQWDPSKPEKNVPAMLYMGRSSEIDAAMVLESARWADNRGEPPYTREGQWLSERDRLLNSYFRERSRVVLGQFDSVGLSASVAAPVLSQYGGSVPVGFELELTDSADTSGVIYYTLNGQDPREFGTGAVSTSAHAYNASLTISSPTVVKSRLKLGPAWSALTEAVFSPRSYYDSIQVTRVMYHPVVGRALEFIEMRNFGTTPVDLTGAAFVDGIDFEFPAGSSVTEGEFVVLVSNQERFSERYPTVEFAGVYGGSLSNSGERVTFSDILGDEIFSFRYDDENGWPISADGFGSALVVGAPGSDLSDPRGWKTSTGSFGFRSGVSPAAAVLGVVINEVLSRSTAPYEDAIEIFNGSGSAVDVGGWYLSDDRDNADTVRKFRVPDGTVVPPGGYVVFYEEDFGGGESGFSLDGSGEGVYLSAADSEFGTLLGYVVGFEFDASDENVSYGLVTTSLGNDVARLERPTFGVQFPSSVEEFRLGTGLANADPIVGPVVVSEIHYSPRAGAIEYVELQNLTDAPVELYDAALSRGWQLAGLSNPAGGGCFEFPRGSVIPPSGFVLLVATSSDLFRLSIDVPADVDLYQFGGALDNGGERLRLNAPLQDAGGELGFMLIDAVAYDNEAPWPEEVERAGRPVFRRNADQYGNDPMSWTVSTARGGSPGRTDETSCVVERRIFPTEIGYRGDAGVTVAVTLRGDNFFGNVDVTEIVPSGWTFVDDGGGLVDGRRLTFTVENESEIRYSIQPAADSECAHFLITGAFTGDCGGAVSGDEAVACRRSATISEMLMRVDVGNAGICQAEVDSEWVCMTGCGTFLDVQGSGIDVTLESADSFDCYGRDTAESNVPDELKAVADDLLFAGGVCGPPNGGFEITLQNLVPDVAYVFQSFHFWAEANRVVMPGIHVTGATLVVTPAEIISDSYTFTQPATTVFVADSSTVTLRLFAPPCTALPPQQAVLNGFVFGIADGSGDCEPEDESSCADGIDNDCDDDIDGADFDCLARGVGPFLRGDCDGDGSISGSPTEAIFLLRWAFRGGSSPPCLAACDIEANGAIGATDAIRLLRFVFVNDSPPDAPFPECTTSERRTDVELGCVAGVCRE